MARGLKLIFVLMMASLLMPAFVSAQSNSEDFDILLALTQQDMEMNWWFSVPASFVPIVSPVEKVKKKEYFKILPIYNHYGVSDDNEIKITYDIDIFRPDGSTYESIKSINGYEGEATGPYLLPSIGMIMVCFEPEDPYGEYTVKVTAYDHIKNQQASRSQKIVLEKFNLDQQVVDLNDWFLNYPVRPKPSLALSAFTSSARAYIDEKGLPLWSALWLYKNIYDDNDFLIPHTVDFYKNPANEQQKKDILLLFHLLGKIDRLPIQDTTKDYLSFLETIYVPDPYDEITSGIQLDMLWAEYFATSRVKPIRQILTALNLSSNMGTIEKIKAGEVDKTSEDIQRKVLLEAVFQSALWSINSNCKQSRLVFHYCVGLYESDDLNPVEKRVLGMILQRVVDENNNGEKKG